MTLLSRSGTHFRNKHVKGYLDQIIGDLIIFDLPTAAKLLGMEFRALRDYLRETPKIVLDRNKVTGQVFMTATQFRVIRDHIFEKVEPSGDYDRRALNLPCVRRKLAGISSSEGEDNS